MLQLLCYARMMLQHMPIRSQQGVLDAAGAGSGSISFGSLWELLLLLALKHDNALIRCVVRKLGGWVGGLLCAGCMQWL